jgi:hypothetical protein
VRWKHSAINRKGVPYRDAKTRAQFDRAVAGDDARKGFRGKDVNRERAQAALRERGVDPAQARETLKRDPQARARAQTAVKNVDRNKLKAPTQDIDRDKARAAAQNIDRDKARAAVQNVDRNHAKQAMQNRSRDNALKGAGNAVKTRQQVDRGVASRQGMQRASAQPTKVSRPTGHARPAARPSPRAGSGRAMRRGR